MDNAEINLTEHIQQYDDSSYYDFITSPDNYIPYYYFMFILPKISIILYSIVFALGIIGNGLVIWIARFRMKNTVNAVWFLHLAIADFLCCASIPLRIADWVTFLSLIFNIKYCISSIFLMNLNMTTSVLLLTAMSIDRWVSVMWPFWAKVHRTCNVVRISAAIIWVLSLIITGLVFYVYIFYLGDLREWCVGLRNRYPNFYEIRQKARLLRLVIMFVIPFLIILICYLTVFYKIRQSKRSQRSQRSYRIITAVILGFFICWFPYYIWPFTHKYNSNFITFNTVNTIVITLACVNSCMNPIIYVFMGPGFRQGFLRSIPARIERALDENPEDLCREGEDAGNTRSTDV
ncbi:C3a anaphylatoxin chemotactic receptor-like [Anomaloglossus baeobatrachus]|uniref:C3a anaphylatoxin chemotactic receptor-like n=1 Tax=Anomaloglossus baeobatrachus TaxID=238106 RepID=UPI003F507EFA